MLLRWLVGNVVRTAAEQKVRSAAWELVRQAVVTDEPTAAAVKAARDSLPPCQVAFVFASAIESEGLTKRLQGCVTTHCASYMEHAGRLGDRPVLVVETGVGRPAAAKAVDDLIATVRPPWVVSAGFAGALQPPMRRGQFLMADRVLDVHGHQLATGLRLDPTAASHGCHVGGLLTVDDLVRTPPERQELAACYHALACDMETMAVAEVCHHRKVRLMAVRLITEAVDERLSPEAEALLAQKSVVGRLGAAAGAILQRPSSVAEFWRLREDAAKASDRLAKFLVGVAEQLPPAEHDGQRVSDP